MHYYLVVLELMSKNSQHHWDYFELNEQIQRLNFVVHWELVNLNMKIKFMEYDLLADLLWSLANTALSICPNVSPSKLGWFVLLISLIKPRINFPTNVQQFSGVFGSRNFASICRIYSILDVFVFGSFHENKSIDAHDKNAHKHSPPFINICWSSLVNNKWITIGNVWYNKFRFIGGFNDRITVVKRSRTENARFGAIRGNVDELELFSTIDWTNGISRSWIKFDTLLLWTRPFMILKIQN
jgi:hypothetical protein